MSAYLQVTMNIAAVNRSAAAEVYRKYRGPFLETIDGARSKELLVREADVQVLHGFDTVEHAQAYLNSDLFTGDVVVGLSPLMKSDPDVRIYESV